MNYDLVIIGGGPTGLSIAHYCSKLQNKKILIIEKEKDIGGCHTVYRTNGLFSEHSPRVYFNSYVNFIEILKDMGINFDDVFVKMNYQSFDITKESLFKTFNANEWFSIIYELVLFILDSTRNADITVSTFMKNNEFSEEAYKTIDILCRVSDGMTCENISLNTFFQYMNQALLYQIYTPKETNDKLLFKLWRKYLIENDVDIITEANVNRFYYNDKNEITHCDVIISENTNSTIYGKKFILAIPPKNIVSLIENTGVINAFGEIDKLRKWSDSTKYIEYITVTFHWNKVIKMSERYNFPSSDWSILYETLSDYIDFKDERSKTVISVAVADLNAKSKYSNKTANEYKSSDLLIKEIYRQIKEIEPELTEDYIAILEPSTIYKDDRWQMKGSAYVSNIFTKPISFYSQIYTNLYNAGTHNGRSFFKPTTFESAVSNGLELSRELFPEIKTKQMRGYSLRDLIVIILVILLCLIISFIIYKVIIRGRVHNQRNFKFL